MNTNQSYKWIVDVTLFGLLIVTFFLEATGVEAHQWLGVAAGSLALYHLVDHWDWAVATAGRFLGRATSKARQYFLVDAGLLAGFVATGYTGLVISTWMNLALGSYATWRLVHVVVSLVTLVLTVVKIGLHARWINAMGKKAVTGLVPGRSTKSGAPAALARTNGRREFLQMMGVVSAAALVAFNQGATSLNSETQAVTASDGATAYTGSTATMNSASSTNSSCSIQCGRHCSYPGHCHRYTDQNGNGRCDYGECI